MNSSSSYLKLSPLDNLHRQAGGKMVAFAGYNMPIHYDLGIIKEHLHTRDKVGLFDVSHMGQFILKGNRSSELLETLVCGDIQALKDGKVLYSMITNDDGGIIDDFMVSKLKDQLFLVVNASRKHIDYEIIKAALTEGNELVFETDRALLALQGPYANEVLGKFCPDAISMPYMTHTEKVLHGVSCRISRSGYTGEDGFEISIPVDSAERISRLFLNENNVILCGLGARDTLRLEAGFCLYGSDLDENITPIEAKLAWVIGKTRWKDKTFPGGEKLFNQHIGGVAKIRVGLLVTDRTIARAGTQITDTAGYIIGQVTSGTFGPTLGASLAMGYINHPFSKPGTEVGLLIRGKELSAKIVEMPFVPHRKNYKAGEA